MHSSTKKAADPKRLTQNGKVYSDLLSAEEKKKLVLQKKKDKKAKKVRKSAQQTIPYVEMCRDGICKVNSRLYTKTIRFNDINYQLAQNEDKTAIFENWCDFLNYFDSSIFVQFSFINQRTSISEFKKQINIPEQDDEFNDIRSEYSEMLQNQLTKGNNGLIKRKYITFGIEADSLRMAKAKLDRIETDILNNFKTLGVKTEPLSGYERLKVLHDVFNMDSNEPFLFSFDMVARTGLSSKDFIAPTSFDFREGKCFKMGKAIGAVSFLQILAPELNDRMLADFLDMDSNITVNLHIRTIDQAKAIKSIKMKITDLDKMKIEEQKKAVRSGYDMEIIPSDLATYGGEAKRLLQDLQTRNERMFLVTPHGAKTGDMAEEVRKRRQLRPDELEDAECQAQAETPSSDTMQEYKPGDLPVSDEPAAYAPHSEGYHAHSVDYGKAFANIAVTGKVSRVRAERQIDVEAVLERAVETSAEMPDFGGNAPASWRIERLKRKSQKAHERLDVVREKLPAKKVLKKERVFDEETGKGKTRLYFEDELKVTKGQSKLQFEADKTVRKLGDTLISGIHGKIHEAEQENSGVEAAHKTEIAAESVVRHYQHHKERSANKPFEKVSKLEQKAEAADRKLHFEKTVAENPEIKTSRANMNKHYQKQHIKKEYAAARRAGAQTASTATKSTGKAVREKASDKVKSFISKNKKVFAWMGVGLMILILLSAGISSCTAMFTSTTSSVIATSYLSEDDAMTGAEAQYCQMESELQEYLDNYESTHDYDEYHFDLDEIEHDPYVLISILSAFNEGEFTLDEVQGLLQTLFDRQYILTEDVEVEVRYRTETRTDSEGTRLPYR